MSNKILFPLLAAALFLGVDCKDDPPIIPPQSEKKITLTLQDTTCTEAWLQLKFANFTAPHSYKIYRDTTLAFAGILFANDTVLIDTALLPQRQYSYKALRLESNVAKDSSAVLQIKTMDTTSHEFVWEIFTLGDGNASALRDVAIINDTLAYAVGEIYLRDSTGQLDPEAYNAAIWNGLGWNLIRIPTESFGGAIGFYSINAIFSFDIHNVWTFSIAGSYSFWNGIEWKTKYVNERSGGGLKIWGANTSKLFLAGTNGSISYYNGALWQKIESGTTLDFTDIYGAFDKRTGKEEILAVASKVGSSLDRKIVKIEGTTVLPVSDQPIGYALSSVWFDPQRRYYVAGSGIYVKRSLSDTLWKNKPLDITPYYTTRIRGNAVNDLFAVGAFGEVLHYNGMSWRSYRETTQILNGAFTSVAVKGDLVIAVGQESPRGRIIIGRRQH